MRHTGNLWQSSGCPSPAPFAGAPRTRPPAPRPAFRRSPPLFLSQLLRRVPRIPAKHPDIRGNAPPEHLVAQR